MSKINATVAALFEKFQDHGYSNYPTSEAQETSLMQTWVESFERNKVRPSEALAALHHWVDTNKRSFMPMPAAFLEHIKELRAVQSASIEDTIYFRPQDAANVRIIGSRARFLEDNPGAIEGVDYFTAEQYRVLEHDQISALPEHDHKPSKDFSIVRRDA